MPVIPANLPPFVLTVDQRATLDALSHTPAGDDARTMHLQVWHQQHCAAHRQIVGVWDSLNPATFSREWAAREAEFTAEAWSAYLGFQFAEAAE